MMCSKEKEIPGGFPGEGDEKGKYLRVMKSLDVSDEEIVAKPILPMLSFAERLIKPALAV